MQSCNVPVFIKQTFCEPCILAKTHQLLFHDSTSIYTHPLELAYMDIWGPIHIHFSNGSRYYIAFLDVYFKYVWLYLLSDKSQTKSVFHQSFKIYSENQTRFQLKSVQSDNAKYFYPSNHFLFNMELKKGYLARMSTNKMVPLNASIVTILKLVMRYLLLNFL